MKCSKSGSISSLTNCGSAPAGAHDGTPKAAIARAILRARQRVAAPVSGNRRSLRSQGVAASAAARALSNRHYSLFGDRDAISGLKLLSGAIALHLRMIPEKVNMTAESIRGIRLIRDGLHHDHLFVCFSGLLGGELRGPMLEVGQHYTCPVGASHV